MGAIGFALLLILTLEVSVPEFLDLQTLPASTLQTRFHLPEHCQPRLTALSLSGNANRLLLLIDCEAATPLFEGPEHRPVNQEWPRRGE